MKLGANELRDYEPTGDELAQIKRNPIYLILDEILDTFNIGSMFRLADALACEKIYLCGDMETPPSSRIHKAAVGTENWVPWEHKDSAHDAIVELKDKGVEIIAIEQDSRAVPYFEIKPNFPIALVLGHETKGVSKEALQLADIIAEIPMYGVNESFNVWGSASVVAFNLLATR